MAPVNLRRFSCPQTLKTVAPNRLLAFLKPHEKFLRSRGVTLPRAATVSTLDYDKLARIFMMPDENTPPALIEALYLVDEMATPEGMDALLEQAQQMNLKLSAGSDYSPTDIAVQFWLKDRMVLERLHAERYLTKVRSFESYQMEKSPIPTFKRPSEKQLEVLAHDLDNLFDLKMRGRGLRVIMCDKDDGIWFLVRHGEPFKREESIKGTKASSIYYRPLKYDVVVYSPQIGELRINARAKWERKLYRDKFGRHLFGDEDIFPGTGKYTLEPLREFGEDSLTPGDIDGIESIVLQEIQLYVGGHPPEIVTRKADDFFAMLKSRSESFPEVGKITRATFRVKFSDAKTPRSVVIKPCNIAQFTRDDDSVLVEQWLQARGFIINPGANEIEEPEAILEST